MRRDRFPRTPLLSKGEPGFRRTCLRTFEPANARGVPASGRAGWLRSSRGGSIRRIGAFTLIELLVVMAIIATLLALVAPRYFGSLDHSKEVVLMQSLATIRDAIDKHYGDTGRYPDSLQDLVDKRYLRSMPVDPITESTTTWELVPPPDSTKGGVYDVHSGAPGATGAGKPFADL